MQTHPRLSLIQHFNTLPDPRVRGRCAYDLSDVLVIALCCLLCGGEGFNDMEDFGRAKADWFRTFLHLLKDLAKHDTFNRIFAALKPAAFLECFVRWTQSLRTAVAHEIVALDGKVLRRALEAGQSPRYIVSAWAASNRLVLGQLKVADKSNEITAVPGLLRVLELAGCIVTLDAMGCQKNIAKEIQEADADYVLALKGNQGRRTRKSKRIWMTPWRSRKRARPSWRAVRDPKPHWPFWKPWRKIMAGWRRGATGRAPTSIGLKTEPSGKACAAWGWWRACAKWASKGRPSSGATTCRACRWAWKNLPGRCEGTGAWRIHCTGFWTCSVAKTPAGRARGHAAENLATLRRLTLNLLKKDQTRKRGIKGKQLNAGWDHPYLQRLLAF